MSATDVKNSFYLRIIAFETAKLFWSIYSTPSSPEASTFFYFKINHIRHSAIYSYVVCRVIYNYNLGASLARLVVVVVSKKKVHIAES
jgi:hypothetical protein